MVVAKSKEDLAKKESRNQLKKDRMAEGYYWKSPGSAEAERNSKRIKENTSIVINIDDGNNQNLKKFGFKNPVVRKELTDNGNKTGN